ncbi:MAG TPA: hypothetical protein VGE83_03460 [Terracidiphilus sp.]|jgi:hypothetical protein
MRKDTLVVVLTAAASGLCWWPALIEPSLDFPRWLLLVPVALSTGLSTILSGGRWLRSLLVSVAAAFVGLCSGFAIFPPSDGIESSYIPIIVAFAMAAVTLVSLLTALAGRFIAMSKANPRHAFWALLICCAASGPVALALTPPLVALRVARNDRIAEERFQALKRAVERTWSAPNGPASVCNGLALRRNYSGPPFSDQNWSRIAGNYVTEDGYVFGIYCQEQGGYVIDASPVIGGRYGGGGYGSRKFCTDESGKIGCGVEWNRSRNACAPCPS